MKVNTDVDIDVFDRDILLEDLKYIVARIEKDGEYTKHNTGVYFQPIPHDPLTNIATIDHKAANDLGYFKIDFLNNSVYKGVRDEAHLQELVDATPQWDLLEHKEIVEKLVHIHSYADLVKRLMPESIPQLAMILAVIRPAKAHLRKSTWEEIEKEVWIKPEEGYYFKKSHAHAFALSIVVQLNLMVEEALKAS
jgi:hypothetical protein